MVSHKDREHLNQATQLLREVIARHRGEDLRAVTLLTEAIQDIRVSARYLDAAPRLTQPASAA
jgi:hypothetical protein